eukprot:jgi/Botrbrau1/2386/Bobra.0395s0018.1
MCLCVRACVCARAHSCVCMCVYVCVCVCMCWLVLHTSMAALFLLTLCRFLSMLMATYMRSQQTKDQCKVHLDVYHISVDCSFPLYHDDELVPCVVGLGHLYS